jgi:three-Cys-motif partner protein
MALYSNTDPERLDYVLNQSAHEFGGQWTSQKLERLRRYLRAYIQVFKNQNFLRPIYIDAFAGSGYIDYRNTDSSPQLAFNEFRDESAERFIEGSATIALQVDPPFHQYIFIEQNKGRRLELEALKDTFPERARSIVIAQADANLYLQKICAESRWKSNRAVLFLDPYGMQVKWETLEAIASTKAIDVWYLFPLGVGINRLLTTNGQIDPQHQLKLDEIFGTDKWKDRFYSASSQKPLFGEDKEIIKVANFDIIESFFVERLQTLFPTVAQKPFRLKNSRGNPLYSLCFAAGNSGNGGKIALRIANHILKPHP